MGTGDWKPIPLSRSGPPLTYLFFVDHLFLFSEASEQHAMIMEDILRQFCSWSGQKINMGESKLFVSCNTSTAVAMAISSNWGIPFTDDLGKYLGVPMLNGCVTNHTYKEVVVKTRKKLAKWWKKSLSKAACRLLIKIVSCYLAILCDANSQNSMLDS